jgi:predicted ATPase
LRGIAERGALAPLFIVATTRPEFRPPWSMRSHHGTISLAPLDRAQVRDMVAELSARHALPRDVVEDVAARTGGVPLFVEEVTRLLLERGEQGGGIETIPPTLQQSLMARLDRLGPAREVAQIGSVIGRGFSYKLLRDVAGMEQSSLLAALEKLAEADIVLVQGQPPESDYRFKHALIQDAAYENLLKSRRQVLHRRVAETLRDRFADTAAAEPEVLAHHCTQAGMTDDAIEWWGKAGDQALRRSAFQEAIAHLGKAIDMADKVGEGAPRAAATPATASVGQRLKLQTSYGQALMWSKGYASEETKAAVSRAQELAGNVDDPSERFATYYGQWAGELLRAELNSALETATAFLRDAENAGRPTEAAVAQRFLGLTILWQSDFIEARARLNEALRIYDSERDHDAKFRFGTDTGAVATVHLAQANWLLGNVDQARELMQEAVTRAGATTHAPTVTNVDYFRAVFEVLRGDTEAALRTADSLLELTRQHGISVYATLGTMCSGWARAQLGDREAGVAEFREALATYTGQGNKGHVPLYQGLLAELEADGQDTEAALTRMDAALALAAETGEHWTDSFLHRVRGEILLKLDPANTAPAEETFLTAIAIAQQQKARSFELRAALSLANLYQSTGRAADAHAVLAPALEGFSPTPEFPEIEQAQTLLAALAATDEVKNAAASRQRRLKLQTSYGRAMMLSRGFASEESKIAFTRAQQLAAGIENATERFTTYYGLWVGSVMRGELELARKTAEAFQRDAENGPWITELVVAGRSVGMTCLWQGDFTAAEANLEQALRIYEPDRDREGRFRFGTDAGVSAMAYLAHATWQLGKLRRAREMMEEAVARAVESAHVPTLANACYLKAMFETVCGNAETARSVAETVVKLSQDHGVALYIALGTLSSSWARARLTDRQSGAAELRLALAAYIEQGNKLFVPLYQGLLAEFDAEVQGAEVALAHVDKALALTQQTGEHWTDAFLHRIRGEILLKRDPANTAPAEDTFLAAIEVAQQQKARTFELQAALPLAKLYQSSGRAADAHAVLAPALEGFSPTQEFPEIEQAQTLVAALADTDEVKRAAAFRKRQVDLQLSYGNALITARGHGASETMAAFARARQLAAGIADPVEQMSVFHGQWAGSFIRCEISLAREVSAAALQIAERHPDTAVAAVAYRLLGSLYWYDGDFASARQFLERSVALFDPERDRELALRFGQDIGVAFMNHLAFALWPLGETLRAQQLQADAVSRARQTEHVSTLAYWACYRAMFEMMRLDAAAAAPFAAELVQLAKAHELQTYKGYGAALNGWARAAYLGELAEGIAEMRQGIEDLRQIGINLITPLIQARLASLEAKSGACEGAIARVDQALAYSARRENRTFDAELHRVRGEILLERDPANTAPAEEAFLTAIAIAQEQKARSFELRAALSLAKLYQSTNRAADAHAVLAPALEGFYPTPDFPEIAESQALLASIN